MKTKRILSIILIMFLFSIVCAEPPDWQQIPGTLYSMLLNAHILFNGELFEGIGNNMAGAFCFTDSLECREVATWQEPNPPHWEGYWHFTIVGNVNGQEISFKIYDDSTDVIYNCSETIIFENNTTIGSAYDPYQLTVIVGDFNSDGYVDAADLQMFADHWHFDENNPGWDPLYNLDNTPDLVSGLQIIDAGDLQVFGDHWHEGSPPKSIAFGKSEKGPNEDAGIRFDLDATTYGNQNDTIMAAPNVGDYIRVDVYAINVHNLDTYEFEVNYNPSQLEYITTTPTNPITFEGNILESNGGQALGWMIDTSTPGVLSIAYTLVGTDTLEAPEGEGLIADIVFQVLSTIGDSLTFGDVYFYDSFSVMDIITDKGIAIIPGSAQVEDNGFDTIFRETKFENYPNPFKFNTTISYAIKGRKKADEFEIKIYNLCGQLVETIKAKNGKAVWDAGNLSAGIYFYQIKSGNYSKVKKMLLLR